jgi:hypothetical protein
VFRYWFRGPIGNGCRLILSGLFYAPVPVSAHRGDFIFTDVKPLYDGSTPEGKQYIEAYYNHAAEITQIIFSDLGLKQDFVSLVDKFLPVVKSIINKKHTALSQSQKSEITAFLNRLHGKSSPALKAVIQRIKIDTKNF